MIMIKAEVHTIVITNVMVVATTIVEAMTATMNVEAMTATMNAEGMIAGL